MRDTVRLPNGDGTLENYLPVGEYRYGYTAPPAESRRVLAAAHVVANPLSDAAIDGEPVIDWEATLHFRRHLFDLGLGVAEAMDTAQRGMGLNWRLAIELIRQTCSEAKARGAVVVAGAQTDQIVPGSAKTLAEVTDAYLEQCAAVEEAGATVVIMASRELCRIARGPEDYAIVYSKVLASLSRPAILHWLGSAFDPALHGYWGHDEYQGAAESCMAIIRDNAPRIEGIKCSLLDQRREIELRAKLPQGVVMYTGDDFDFPTTIGGDGERYSHALLGAFDFLAPMVGSAFDAIDRGDLDEFRRKLDPSLPLARHVFSNPTYYYKTGVVFLAYLSGFQSHFRMIGGLESGRSVIHLAHCYRLGDGIGLFPDPELAMRRMKLVLALAGVED